MKKMIWSAMLALGACTADVVDSDTTNMETDTVTSVDTDVPEVDETGSAETGSDDTDVIDTDVIDTDVIDTDALDTDPGVTEPQRIDNDGDGFTQSEGDCNDADPSINPGAPEVCDRADNNCNIAVDEDPAGGALDCERLSSDDDADGYLDNDGGPGWGNDCNDTDASINPGAPEVCDGVDNNCNIAIDESAVGAPDWYEDADRDGFGSLTGRVFGGPLLGRCSAPTSSPMGPVYYVDNHLDCDDADPTVGPCP